MLEILTKITQGKGTMEDLAVLTELAEMVGSASLCGLGQTAPNPVLTTLRHFRNEYEAHIIDKHCPAAVCQALFRAPCQHTCPVELDCSGYIALAKEGRFVDAYKLIRQRLPFPMSVGRVCDHPCEVKCRRGQVDAAVSIRDLKRVVADYAYEHGVEFLPPVKPRKPERVAIVGAGPAGLTAAYELAREGYGVTVFEALPVAGGMMAVAIPEYRLPKRVLNAEIDSIIKLGIELKLNTRVEDVSSLFKDGYKAVFIACGAHKGDKMGIPGEDAEGIFDAIEFLKEANLGKKPKVGRRVAVVGGGNSAIDAARVALRQGAEEVRILYRREHKDMPAIAEEIASAEEEGIHIDCLTAPTKVLTLNGKITALECIRMELREFDSSGRRTPHTLAVSEYTIPVDTLIKAIGQRPDTTVVKDSGVKTAKGGIIAADPRTLATDHPGVFAGGDVVSGPKTVIWAVAAGQRAAHSIIRYLQGEPLSPFIHRDGYEVIEVPAISPTEEEVKERKRVEPSQVAASERKSSFREIVSAFTGEQSREEASRCLRCDLEAGAQE
jgi:NADH-quinone oxidoreductase subunit F